MIDRIKAQGNLVLGKKSIAVGMRTLGGEAESDLTLTRRAVFCAPHYLRLLNRSHGCTTNQNAFIFPPENSSRNSKSLVNQYMTKIVGLDGSPTVILPTKNESSCHRVRKITFVSVNGDDNDVDENENRGHPAPDPFCYWLSKRE